MNLTFTKGNLISKRFYFDSTQKWVPNPSPEHLLFRWIVLKGVIRHSFFEDLNRSEKHSEIKPFLEGTLWISFCLYLCQNLREGGSDLPLPPVPTALHYSIGEAT